MKEYLDYDQKYPDLIVRLVQFFKNNSKGEKKIWEFCESYKVPKGEDIIQPIVVGKICDRLWERSILYCINRGLGLRTNDSFASLGVDQEVYEKYPDVKIIAGIFNRLSTKRELFNNLPLSDNNLGLLQNKDGLLLNHVRPPYPSA